MGKSPFAHLQKLKEERSGIQAVPASDEPAPLPLHGTVKSRHPDYEKAGIYVPKKLKRETWRLYEDATGGDFSDLVRELLVEYQAGRTKVAK